MIADRLGSHLPGLRPLLGAIGASEPIQEGLLDRLLHRISDEIVVGVRQRAEALTLIARFAGHGLPPQTPQDFARILSPLLATSAESQKRIAEICAEVLGAKQVTVDLPESAAVPLWLRTTRFLRARPVVPYLFFAIVLLTAAYFVGERQTPDPPPRRDPDDIASAKPPDQPAPVPPVATPDKDSRAASLVRRTLSAGDDQGMATLRAVAIRLAGQREITPGVFANTTTGFIIDRYLLQLVDYTGFAPDQLLPMWYANVVARISHAAARIEFAGNAPPIEDIQRESRLQSAALTSRFEAMQAAARACEQTPSLRPDYVPCQDTVEVKKYRALRAFADGNPFAEAWPWEGDMPPASTATYAPAGVAWAAAALPLVVALIWFGWRMSRYRERWREELRREVPANHPLRHPDLSANARRLAVPDEPLRLTAQTLARRTVLPSRQIDVRRTVGRMARSGNPFDFVLGESRPPAEYLLLIETASGPDHQARGFQRLADRLRSMDLSIESFYYVTSPRRCFRTWGEDAVSLESLATDFPNRRLVILGQGRSLLDPVDLKPVPWAHLLETWPRRALLTPVPARDWRAEEVALASDLGLALGRATPDGLRELPALLGLEGRDRSPIEVVRDQQSAAGTAQPSRLPTLLATPQRWLANRPPRAGAWDELRSELGAALDHDGYAWLAACALYPTIDWDLTLFLGQQVHNAAGRPLYSERRLAIMSALPWFRSNRMPDWLRAALLNDLPERQKEQALHALHKLLKAPPLKEHERRRWAAAPALAPVAGRPYRDTIFVEALVEGQRGDKGAPEQLNRLLRPIPFSWGSNESIVAGIAILYAAAAWTLSPKAGDGALGPGSWLPLAILGLTSAVAVWIAASTLSGRDVGAALLELMANVFELAQRAAQQPPMEEAAAPASAPSQKIFVCAEFEDVDRVSGLLHSLRAEGWHVSSPADVPYETSASDPLATAIDDTDLFIAVWSDHSIRSERVLASASRAKALGKALMNVGLDESRPPPDFSDLWTFYLQNWSGGELPDQMR